jgi:hypothetical protein
VIVQVIVIVLIVNVPKILNAVIHVNVARVNARALASVNVIIVTVIIRLNAVTRVLVTQKIKQTVAKIINAVTNHATNR